MFHPLSFFPGTRFIKMGGAKLAFYNLTKITKALDMTVSELIKDFEEK